MLRTFLCSVVALLFVAGVLLAAEGKEGTIVKVDKDKNTITVKVGDEEQTVDLEKDRVKLVNAQGRAAKIGDFRTGQKVEVFEKDGKITEIRQKKASE